MRQWIADGRDGAEHHADARGRARLQEEPDRGDGRLRRASSTRCPIAPLYKDVVQLLAQSGHDVDADADRAVRRPVGGELLVRAPRHPDAIAKLARFTPHDGARASRRCGGRAGARDSQYSASSCSRSRRRRSWRPAAASASAATASCRGSAYHWEMWNIAQGGMPNHDVLRVGDDLRRRGDRARQGPRLARGGQARGSSGARRNPLEDIRNTNTIRYVMKNGRLYDANTLRRDLAARQAARQDVVDGGAVGRRESE